MTAEAVSSQSFKSPTQGSNQLKRNVSVLFRAAVSAGGSTQAGGRPLSLPAVCIPPRRSLRSLTPQGAPRGRQGKQDQLLLWLKHAECGFVFFRPAIL